MPRSAQQIELTRQRKEAIAAMSAQGLELGAMAHRLGISTSQVMRLRRELKAEGVGG